MESKNIFLGSILVIAVAVTAGFFLMKGEKAEVEKELTDQTVNSSEIRTTEDGTRYIVHPDELRQGCPGMDCIPSIDNPNFVSGNPDWLQPGDRVIGVELNGETRAYPLKILAKHEIVNDNFNGEPVVVTYCPLCRSGVTYSREVNGETLEFGVSGKLLDANLVMYDRATETYWNQISGKAIIGPLTGEKLELKFSSITTWEKWREAHPETEVLSRNTGIYPVSTYERNPYSGYQNSERVGFGVDNVDDRLPAKKLVLGISLGNESKAYTQEAVENKEIIHDSLGGKPIVVIQRPDDGTFTAYIRQSPDQEFTLEQEGLRDQNGELWNFDGEQVNGDGEMEKITPQGFYWFAWSKFHPDTKLYKPSVT